MRLQSLLSLDEGATVLKESGRFRISAPPTVQLVRTRQIVASPKQILRPSEIVPAQLVCESSILNKTCFGCGGDCFIKCRPDVVLILAGIQGGTICLHEVVAVKIVQSSVELLH